MRQKRKINGGWLDQFLALNAGEFLTLPNEAMARSGYSSLRNKGYREVRIHKVSSHEFRLYREQAEKA